MYKPHGITCKIMYFHDVISQSIRQGVTKKSGVSTLSSFRKEILNLDVNNLTPLEALNKLNDIKRIVKGK